ncbi:hypothetical protein FOMPIDRAFT_1044511 [Fomitopsis schrenkii]|uniref:Uncharacterized protein n=1 Tax=Fomitopsis schrenkii TaxID=2126942 RepID=S8ET07_FOMSC|nr:hypothetical protein FOMPIDRAFT_1044511 [Fomitopsis schrenkii]
MPLEAAAPTLIERPRTIAYHASISKDGRNTLRDQMGLNLEQFDEFVGVIQEALDLFLDALCPWTRQDNEAQKRYIDYVVADWPQSSRYKDNWPIIAYTVKHAKLGYRHGRSSPRGSPAKAKPSVATTLAGTNEPSLPGMRHTKPATSKDDRANLPAEEPRLSARRARVRKVVQPRKRTRNPVSSSVVDARPKKVIKYVGAPPPSVLKRALNYEMPRAPGSSANARNSEAGFAAPFRVRGHANVASGSTSRSAGGEAAVRGFLLSLIPPLPDLLPHFLDYGVRDHVALMALATSPPQTLHRFLDSFEETMLKIIVLRRGIMKLGQVL